ncbi:acyl-CoA desaturase [Ramlibacter pallidus]|nr:acyl-CoA desaturase [Ramlibacter pallidus]
MHGLPESMQHHRVQAHPSASVVRGTVRWSPGKSLWFTGMGLIAVVGGAATFSWTAVAVFLIATGTVLLLGHSLGSHRKMIHDSFGCPRWLERTLVWLGVQVGLAGPIGLLRQHELRDFAQRLPHCHPYLRHGSGFWTDAWWQLHCELELDAPPDIAVEARIADDPFYRWLERTWRWQQLPLAVLLLAIGGWSFVVWGVCARITAGVFGHWLIGYFAHNHGPMHHVVDGAAVQGHNIRWTSLLTMGESWHNNHHAFPGSARLGIGPGEWDPGWWALVALQKCGLAWNLRTPDQLLPRVELRALDAVGARTGDDQGAVPTWRELWAWSDVRRVPEPLVLRGPSVTVPARAFAWLLGGGGNFTRDRAAQRLSGCLGGFRMSGLPALWLATARRSPLHRYAALAWLPAATGLESLRRFASVPR